ncbi:MAG: hypothetical protein HN380_12575 [Victivallales bacterium]|nr:hypothetical protein [Victivallales bacterium]
MVGKEGGTEPPPGRRHTPRKAPARRCRFWLLPSPAYAVLPLQPWNPGNGSTAAMHEALGTLYHRTKAQNGYTA